MREGTVFDPMAVDYDASFTDSPVGRLMRAAIQRRLAAVFKPGQRVLELSCGTGEDAAFLAERGVRVLASDASAAMVEQAREKLQARGLQERVELRQWAIEELPGRLPETAVFDGVLSDFGGLNCIADYPALSRTLGRCVRPGGRLLWCLMGRYAPWEWFWFGLRGQFRRAGRRLGGSTEWRGMTIHYPLPARLAADFRPVFRPVRLAGIGFLIPPSYAGAWLGRVPRVAATLAWMERGIETLWPVPRLSDHYLLELERT